MIRRDLMGWLFVILVVTVALCLTAGPRAALRGGAEATARARTSTRQAIKQMPILMRPHRPGHVYGNMVRRRHSRHISPL